MRAHVVRSRRDGDGWRSPFVLLIADPSVASDDPFVTELGALQVDVTVCRDPAEALVLAGALRPDAVIVADDPGEISSPVFVQAVAKHAGTPTLVGLGPGDGEHAGAALAAGARACVARPYRVPELLPILRSIRPEIMGGLEPVIDAGALRLDPATLEVWLHDQPIRLPMREYHLLRFFMLHAGRVVTREQILDHVWGGAVADQSNTLTVHIKRLRLRLGDGNRDPKIIVTVRGLGYRLIPPAVVTAAADVVAAHG